MVKVNSDLYLLVESLYTDIKKCNADKAALRKWSADMEKK